MATEIKRTTSSRRRIGRIPIKNEFGYTAKVLTEDQDCIEGQIFDLNSLALKLTFKETDYKKLEEKNFTELKLYFGQKEIVSYESIKVLRRNRSSLSIVFKIEANLSVSALKRQKRLTLSDKFRPLIFAKDPILKSENLHFEVLDYHAKGFRLKSSLRNKNLIPNMQLTNCQIVLPTVGIEHVDLNIKWIDLAKSQELHIGCEFVNPTKNFLDKLSQHSLLSQSSRETSISEIINDLQKADFKSNDYTASAEVHPVENIYDYDKALDLRLQAYKAINKVSAKTTAQDMADIYDTHSTVLVASINRKVVGTVRLVNCAKKGEYFPFEGILDHEALKKIPRKNACEISRLAVVPEFQGSRLVLKLMQACFSYALRAGYKHVFCLSAPNTQKLYKRVGAKIISDNIPHPYQKKSKMVLYYFNGPKLIKAQGIRALAWEALAKDSIEQLSPYGFVSDTSKSKFIASKIFMEKLALSLLKNKKSSSKAKIKQSKTQKTPLKKNTQIKKAA